VLALDAFQKGLDLLPDAETDMRSGICPPHRLCAEEALSLSAEFVKSISRCFGNAASDFKSLSPLSLSLSHVCLYAYMRSYLPRVCVCFVVVVVVVVHYASSVVESAKSILRSISIGISAQQKGNFKAGHHFSFVRLL
jgi:hypothetical protein